MPSRPSRPCVPAEPIASARAPRSGGGGRRRAAYYENTHGGWRPGTSTTPTGVAAFAEDIAIRRYAERANKIVHWSDFDEGGHFAAMERPDLLTGDVRAFFRGLR